MSTLTEKINRAKNLLALISEDGSCDVVSFTSVKNHADRSVLNELALLLDEASKETPPGASNESELKENFKALRHLLELIETNYSIAPRSDAYLALELLKEIESQIASSESLPSGSATKIEVGEIRIDHVVTPCPTCGDETGYPVAYPGVKFIDGAGDEHRLDPDSTKALTLTTESESTKELNSEAKLRLAKHAVTNLKKRVRELEAEVERLKQGR